MRRDMLCHWMSTAKPVAAIAIGQLLDRQLLSLASPVATHIPEFGCHGKEAVLVEHLLTHTSGFPFADSECWRDSMGDWSRVLDAICRARLENPVLTGFGLASSQRPRDMALVPDETRLAPDLLYCAPELVSEAAREFPRMRVLPAPDLWAGRCCGAAAPTGLR